MNTKRMIAILLIAIALPVGAFAGKKKDPPPPPQDGTDWLNAPTPDGSPTLKETSDWLNKVLVEYQAGASYYNEKTLAVSIDNSCTLNWTTEDLRDWKLRDKGGKNPIAHYRVPLGAVINIAHSPFAEQSIQAHFELSTGNLAAINHQRDWAGGGSRNETSATIWLEKNEPRANETVVSIYELVPRVQKALQHAVDLCSGTYKAPIQKDPF